MFNINRNSIKKLENRLTGWRFKNKYNFWFFQFLWCILVSYLFFNSPTVLRFYYHYGSVLGIVAKFSLLVCNAVVLLWVGYCISRDTIKFEKMNNSHKK